MKLGTQMTARSDDDYWIMAQLGVTHISAYPPGNPHNWGVDNIATHRDKLERLGLKLEMVQLPLSSRPIDEILGASAFIPMRALFRYPGGLVKTLTTRYPAPPHLVPRPARQRFVAGQ